MENIKLAEYILPSEIVRYYTIVKVETRDSELKFYLEEKSEPPPLHSSKPLESKGFYPSRQIQDFPIRGKPVVLNVRIRKWRDKSTGKIY
jgi:hypothetical protein